jgi:glycine betaine transporter
MMTSNGDLNPSMLLKLIWAVVITAITAATLFTGSVFVAKAMAITGAVPFSLILIVQIIGFLRTLRDDHAPPEEIPAAPRPAAEAGE